MSEETKLSPHASAVFNAVKQIADGREHHPVYLTPAGSLDEARSELARRYGVDLVIVAAAT